MHNHASTSGVEGFLSSFIHFWAQGFFDAHARTKPGNVFKNTSSEALSVVLSCKTRNQTSTDVATTSLNDSSLAWKTTEELRASVKQLQFYPNTVQGLGLSEFRVEGRDSICGLNGST